MVGVNYADALVKARRYEIATESAEANDELVAESIKDIKYLPNRAISAGKKGVNSVANKIGQKIADKNKADALAGYRATKANINAAQQIVDGGDAAKKAAGHAYNAAKHAAADSDAVTAMGKNAIKGFGKKAAIGAAAIGAATAAGIAAKKIHDKKKAAAQNQEEVKENYEYDEYETLIEGVINCFMSDEEIMAENANDIAMATADYMIENVDYLC